MDLAQLLARLRATSSSFSTSQLALFAVAFLVAVGTVIGVAYWSTPGYRLLFADMDPTAASEAIDRLKAQKIPYKIDDGGRAIRVPEDRVDELRLALTAQGLPSSGRIGFEIFDRTAFGETEFLEHVNYRRALEGEIARTIATIGEVSSARVHIAMSKESLFESREQPAKASVILKLKGQQALRPATVTGIASLVASSVEGLRPESVVILDNFGRPLTRPAEAEESTGLGLERQQRLEHDMSGRVVSLLEPIVGAGRVRVNVAVRLNAEARDETEEQYDPTTVIRSHQSNNDSQQAGAPGAVVAGARGNLAPTATQPTVTGVPLTPSPAQAGVAPLNTPPLIAPGGMPATASSRVAETTNFEVSKRIRHSTTPRGELARLWVAVLVDDDVQVKAAQDGKPVRTQKPRTSAELQKLQGLVAAAVGLDQERGDQLTVENITFETPATDSGGADVVGPPFVSSPRSLWVGLSVAGIVVALVAIGLGVRVMMKQPAPMAAVRGELPKGTVLPKTVQDLQNEIEAQLNAEVEKAGGSQKLPALARRVGTLASKEPEAVALLVRSWITEDRR